MATRRMALVCGVMVCVLGIAAPAIAQGKKKTPSSYPGVVGFRCDPAVVGECAAVGPTSGDGVVAVSTLQNGSLTYPGSGTPEGGRGAHLRIEGASNTANHEMWVGLRDGFEVLLNFGPPDPEAPCRQSPNNYCQYPGAFGPGAESMVIGRSSYAEFQTAVVDDGSTETLMTLPIDAARGGAPSPVRLNIGFNDPSGRLWNFNFSDARSPGRAENASVWRTGSCTWVISDNGSHAELSTLVRISGKQFRSFEGFYSAPFEITFTAPGCPAQ